MKGASCTHGYKMPVFQSHLPRWDMPLKAEKAKQKVRAGQRVLAKI